MPYYIVTYSIWQQFNEIFYINQNIVYFGHIPYYLNMKFMYFNVFLGATPLFVYELFIIKQQNMAIMYINQYNFFTL